MVNHCSPKAALSVRFRLPLQMKNVTKPSHSRVAGLLIKGGKVLLVTGYEESVYWTPGGKKENLNENDEITLGRELSEELNIKVLEANFFMEYQHPTREGKSAATRAYLVNWEGEILPQKEITKADWFGKTELKTNSPTISSSAREFLFPKLIEAGLLK